MNILIHIFTPKSAGILIGLLSALAPSLAFAGNLTVIFTPDPLFTVGNFAPGDTASGTAEVGNGSGEAQTILTTSSKETNDAGSNGGALGDAITLRIYEGNAAGALLFDGTLTAFFTDEWTLGTLADGATTTYLYEAAFAPISGNEYQGASLGFDLCVGFSGAEFYCGGEAAPAVVSTIGGGGGGTSQVLLVIFNEGDTVIPPATSNITWNTNMPASSRVFYGLASGGPYVLDPNQTNYGYPSGTSEVFDAAQNHTVSLAGLVPGETYVYRVASRRLASHPLEVSPEYEFTLPLAFGTPPEGGQTGGGGAGGEEGGTGDGEAAEGEEQTGDDGEAPAGEDAIGQAAAAFLGLPEGFFDFSPNCFLSVLLILLVLYVLWLLWDRLLEYARTLTPHGRRTRQALFLIAGVIAVVGVLIMIGYSCAIAPLLGALAVLAARLAYLLIRGKDNGAPPPASPPNQNV